MRIIQASVPGGFAAEQGAAAASTAPAKIPRTAEERLMTIDHLICRSIAAIGPGSTILGSINPLLTIHQAKIA
jgi:hypothetical protein